MTCLTSVCFIETNAVVLESAVCGLEGLESLGIAFSLSLLP